MGAASDLNREGTAPLTSEERREARYQRRKAKREAKALETTGKAFDEVINFGNMVESGEDCCDGSRWKTSTILFETHLLPECADIVETLAGEKRRFKGFHSFTTVEHGKARQIDALPIQERAGQKCLCQHYLTKAFSRSFISTNSASLEGRGMDYALETLHQQLTRHFRRYGLEGGIYQFDFKGYFGSLPHDLIKARARRVIRDDRLYRLYCSYIDDFLKMKTADPKAKRKRGVGLGSEVSQITALDAASPIDHYFKDRRRVEAYGRYMDDGYAISPSLEELRDLDRCNHLLAADLGLTLNDKKCTITPFKHHSFTFLKVRFTLQESGKVTMKLSRQSIKAIRRKMDIFRAWVTEGQMDAEDAIQSYQSWRAHAKRCDSYRTLEAMDARFTSMFAPELRAGRTNSPAPSGPRRQRPGGSTPESRSRPPRPHKEGAAHGIHRPPQMPGTLRRRRQTEPAIRHPAEHHRRLYRHGGGQSDLLHHQRAGAPLHGPERRWPGPGAGQGLLGHRPQPEGTPER